MARAQSEAAPLGDPAACASAASATRASVLANDGSTSAEPQRRPASAPKPAFVLAWSAAQAGSAAQPAVPPIGTSNAARISAAARVSSSDSGSALASSGPATAARSAGLTGAAPAPLKCGTATVSTLPAIAGALTSKPAPVLKATARLDHADFVVISSAAGRAKVNPSGLSSTPRDRPLSGSPVNALAGVTVISRACGSAPAGTRRT